ncbi:MAG: SusF/SusE family outer membrane protein [Duncaniella sp.]|nr:SusF/SusE family outer membrane protein [Duncaniella sp.]
MKYSALFGLAALALGFTACDDIEDSNSLPQSNPQLDIVSAENASISAGPAASSVIDLEALNNSASDIAIATVATAPDWPEGFTPSVPYMQVSKDQAFETFETIDATMGAEGQVLIAPDAWEETYMTMYGKNPNATTSYVRFPIMAVNGDQKVRMGGENYYYGNFAVTVKPFDLFGGQVIEDAYYLINSVDNFDFSKAVKLAHSDKDPYDDPVFQTIINVNGAGYQWAIIPATTFTAGSLGQGYGVTNPTDLTGTLVAASGSNINYGVIDQAGPYMVTVNMETLTYEVKAAYPMLYTPGDTNGWNQAASQVLTTSNYITYEGYAHLSGGFKLSTQPNWDGVSFGAGDPGKLSSDGGAANLTVDADGLYWVSANVVDLTYTLTPITTIGLIGDATPDGWDASTALQPSADFLVWTAQVALTDGTFKFRANDGWDINLGGSLTDLTQGGDNITSPGAGTYTVTLDLTTVPYTATLTK